MSTAAKPRQLNLDELRRLKWLLGGFTVGGSFDIANGAPGHPVDKGNASGGVSDPEAPGVTPGLSPVVPPIGGRGGLPVWGPGGPALGGSGGSGPGGSSPGSGNGGLPGTSPTGGSGSTEGGRPGWGTAGGELNPLARDVIAGVNQWNLGSNLPKLFGIPVALGTGLGTFEIAGGWLALDTGLEIAGQRMMHVMARHAFGGAFNSGNTSTFFSYLTRTDLRLMARSARLLGHSVPQAGGRLAWIVRTGGLVGIDRYTRAPTSFWTMIEQDGYMVTMFPGLPR